MISDDKFITSEVQWVKDEPKVWAMNGKTLDVKGGAHNGLYIMRVTKEADDGSINPGHVIVSIVEKHD